jgi:23S rRNA (uracil1939-C5)-methyltransferase
MNKTSTNKTISSEVTITRIGIHGDGIAKGANERYYVPYSAPGDRLLVAPGAARKEGRAAKIEKIITRGDDRVAPVCRHFESCGGCSLQHVSNRAIANLKREYIITALERRGFDNVFVQDTVNIAPRARRRARFAIAKKGRHTILGFRAPRSHKIIDVQECPAIRPTITALLEPLRRLATDQKALGRTATILVTESDTGLDILLRAEKPRDLSLSDREKLAQFANMHDLARIAWEDPRGPEPVAQRREPRYRFGSAAVNPPIGAFLQPSIEGEHAIWRTIQQALHQPMRIADLYAGCGTLTFPLSSIAPTHAFEGDADMVSAMRRAVAGHPVTASERDLARMPLTSRELEAYDTVVFDPPRAGAKVQAAALADSSVDCIIAVSCNPATLARDLRLLADGGYTIESVQPIDQFPWSSHIEAVAVLRRNVL